MPFIRVTLAGRLKGGGSPQRLKNFWWNSKGREGWGEKLNPRQLARISLGLAGVLSQPALRSPILQSPVPVTKVCWGSCKERRHSLHPSIPSCGRFILPRISLTCRQPFSWHTWRAELRESRQCSSRPGSKQCALLFGLSLLFSKQLLGLQRKRQMMTTQWVALHFHF